MKYQSNTYLLIANAPWYSPDIIDRCEASDRDSAIDYFSQRKILSPEQITQIYTVVTEAEYTRDYQHPNEKGKPQS